jgi:hypothetical protein
MNFSGEILDSTPDQDLHNSKTYLHGMYHSATPGPYRQHWRNLLRKMVSIAREKEYMLLYQEVSSILVQCFSIPSKPENSTPCTPLEQFNNSGIGCSCAEIQNKLNKQTVELKESLEQDRQSIRNDTKEILRRLKNQGNLETDSEKLLQNQKRIINRLDEISGERIQEIQEQIEKILSQQQVKGNFEELKQGLNNLEKTIRENDSKNIQELKQQIEGFKKSQYDPQQDLQQLKQKLEEINLKKDLEQIKNEIQKLEALQHASKKLAETQEKLKEIEQKLDQLT